MAIKLKQYLENSWYRWASQDRQSWYAAQFQYWENVNVRDMKNWVCLSWGSTDVTTHSEEFSYFTIGWLPFIVDEKWVIYEITDSWITLFKDIEPDDDFIVPPIWIDWQNDLYTSCYIVGSAWIYKVWATVTNLTPAWFTWATVCALNYANTYLLVWDWNAVWRVARDWTVKKIRDFDSWMVYWLTQEWNYLKIYVSDGANTKIHYAKWTFDVEDTWLVQTVSFKWLWINAHCVASDQWNDYVAFRPTIWEIKLAKVSWYNKIDIRWTQTWDWERVFYGSSPKIMASDWVVFAVTNEWIWTFTEYNGWLWWWCLEFKEPYSNNNDIRNIFRYWERLYVCLYKWSGNYVLRYYDLSFHPNKYQSNWFIIGRVFDWWCAWLFKKNDQATITYNMPSWTSMELGYRYDRSSFSYGKSNFYPIKKLTDTVNCYDIVVPTTPQADRQENLLRKEEANNLILLENWNWILLEDMMVCPFNRTWNLLEYRIDLNTADTSKTPTLYEHSLTYYDYMRKYR